MPSNFDPFNFDPFKSLNIDPFRYINDPLANNDPFASVNKQLRGLGLSPISLDAPAPQAVGIPSAHTALDDLAPEQLAEAKQKAGGGLLSGLEWVGRKLDSITGARALRGLLGGNPRELLSLGPLGLISDELGLTRPKDIVGGRKLLENIGIIGPNRPGFDAGDVAGFAAEVLLDPATYFFGLGLATKSTKAATQAGKGFVKTGRLDDILDLAKTKKGAEALGLPHTMGTRQSGMNITARQAINAEISGGMDDVLGLPGMRPTGQVIGGSLGTPPVRSLLVRELTDAGVDISKVMDQPLTSPMHVGLPGFLANLGFGQFRPLKGLTRRAVNLQPGGKMESWAQLMDKLGSAARWSVPGRQLSRVFEPKLRKNIAGERVSLTRAAQEKSLQEYRFMEKTAQQAHSAGYEFGQKWNNTVHFNPQKIVDDVDFPAYSKIDNIEDARGQMQKNFDYLNAQLEGYQINKAGKLEIPEWHSDVIKRIEEQYGNRIKDFNKKMNALEKGRFNKLRDSADEFAEFKKTGDNRYAEAGRALRESARAIPKQIEELKVLRDADALQLQVTQASRSSDDINRALDHTMGWEQKEWQLKSGVYNRAPVQLPDHLQELSDDMPKIAKMYSDALAYGVARGLDIEQLADNYAMFSPRKLFRVPETTKGGVLRRAIIQKGDSGYGTQHQLARAEGMRGWFGGTSFINKLSRNKDYVGRITEGMGDIERKDIINDIAKSLTAKNPTGTPGELRIMLEAGGESLKSLIDIGKKSGVELATVQGAWVGNPASHRAVRELAEFLGNLDPRLLDYSVTAFEQNPIGAMMSYYVDVVRASHSVEVAANLIGEHADLMSVLQGDGYKGISIFKMMKSWNPTNRIPPSLQFQVIKKLSTLNDNWDEIFSYFIPQSFTKLDEVMVATIRDGEIGKLVSKFGDDEKLLREIETVFKDVSLPRDLGEDVARYVKLNVDPSSTGELAVAWDHITDILKTSFTTPWPAFHFRNALSGLANNYLIGAADPTQQGPWRYIIPVREARILLRGGTIKGVANEIPRFRGGKNIPAWAAKDPDGYVSEWIRAQARAYDLIGPQHTREHLQAIIERGGDYDLFRNRFYDEVTGERVLKQRVGDAWYGEGGLLKRSIGVAREFGHEVEGYNRLSPLIAFLKQGVPFDEAVRKVKLAQVDYSALTDIEKRVFRRIIPFYTFTRRQIPFVIDRLSDPSSSMSQAVKGISRIKREMDDEENPTPDWISSEFTIPIPGGVEGQQRYITKAGGMLGGMEDVFSLLKPGRTAMGATRRTLSGIGSRMHPFAQAPIELMTGQSLFLQRPLSETKPATARLIGGLTGAERVPSFPGHLVESAISRIPGFGRSVSTLRSLTDPRRPLMVEGEVSFLNIAARMLPSITGLRISEVNMERLKNRIMKEAIEEHLRHNTSIKTFKQIYVPEAELENMDEESRALYLLYKQISSRAAKASRARKKEETAAAAYSM